MAQVIRAATPADLPAIRALLAVLGLPHEDVGPPHQRLLVAPGAAALAGCGGLELHGDAALLRSLVVAPERHGTGVGRALHAALLEEATRLRLAQLWLLTTTAQRFFAGAGWHGPAGDGAAA